MSDQANDMQTKNGEVQNTEFSYGGFSSRLSYERCVGGKEKSVLRVLGIVCICLAFGIFATLCGLLMYQLVESNKELYYPGKEEPAAPEDITAPKIAALEAASAETAASENHLTSITADIARRYLIPEGVMVRDPELLSSFLSAEILEGDIIVSFGGSMINDAETLYSMVTYVECCETKEIVVFRNNEYMVLDAVVGK